MKQATLKKGTPVGSPSPNALQKKSPWRTFKKALPLTMLAVPATVLIFIFCYVPMFGVVLPFIDYKASLGFFGSPFVGLKNFEYLFKGKAIWLALRNTIFYNACFLVIGTACSILLAALLFEMTAKKVKVFQTIYLLPYFVSWVVGSYVFSSFLDYENGMINQVLEFFGAKPIIWYNQPKWWPLIINIAHVWKGVGYTGIVYFSAFMGMDIECFESAKLDGVTWWQRFRYIMLPGIMPVISIQFLMAIGKVLNTGIDVFYTLTKNSALLYSTTEVIDTYVFRALTTVGNIGMSSSVTFVQSIFGFLLVLLSNWLVKRHNPDNALF